MLKWWEASGAAQGERGCGLRAGPSTSRPHLMATPPSSFQGRKTSATTRSIPQPQLGKPTPTQDLVTGCHGDGGTRPLPTTWSLREARSLQWFGGWRGAGGQGSQGTVPPKKLLFPRTALRVDHLDQRLWPLSDSCTVTSFLGGLDGKEFACNAEDPCLIPASRISPGDRNGNPFQYSVLEKCMNRGA